MTNHPPYADTPEFDEAQEFWDEYDGADWYCNHDVPNGCHDCAYVKREADMLDAMTDAERREYFAAQDARWAKAEGEFF